ncbi:MAG: adenylyltransferase/cytidyltransferase family protein [Planctomycetes bacterium]|nr:adenylyltransferase/cytidyltransferase family protein [Planctomycetota bacterium]
MSEMAGFFAPIVELDEFRKLRDTRDLGVVVCTSGGYDPIHPGHISCIVDSRRFGDTVVVVVNDDEFLRRKKGRPFQDLATRCAIVSAIGGIDYVVPFRAPPGDSTVAEALRAIRPRIFTKGGDRVKGKSLPASEESVCREYGIEIVDGVGRDKQWSSSDFLADWGRFWADQHRDERA